MNIIPADQAINNDFAKFNGGPHLCVDVPDGLFTITAKTTQGKKITFAFCPYEKGGPPQTVDVQHHTSLKSAENGSPIQRVICFTPGNHTFKSDFNDTVPTTLLTVLLHDRM